MNVKLISKAIHTLSLLSDEDVQTVMSLRALSEDERQLLITVLEPPKATKKPARKSSVKSARASGMAAAIGRSVGQQRHAPKCAAITNDVINEQCGAVEDDPIHDTKLATGHAFRPATQPPALTAKDDSYGVNVGGGANGG